MSTTYMPTPQERVYYRFENIDDHEDDQLAPVDAECPASLENYESSKKPLFKEHRFWRRQFGDELTAGQEKFDWIVGIFLPLICFYFDPIVFKDHGLLGRFQFPAYAFGFLSILALSAWLLWRERLGKFAGFVGGIFVLSSIVSLTVGIILFPVSLIGTLFLVGFLGFTPLLTTIIYARNAIRALRSAGTTGDVA